MKRIIDDYEFEEHVSSIIKAKLEENLPMVKVNFIDMDYYSDDDDFMFDTFITTKEQFSFDLSKQSTIKAISQITADYILKKLMTIIIDNGELRRGNTLDKINMLVLNSKLIESEDKAYYQYIDTPFLIEDLKTQSASFFIEVKLEIKK